MHAGEWSLRTFWVPFPGTKNKNKNKNQVLGFFLSEALGLGSLEY